MDLEYIQALKVCDSSSSFRLAGNKHSGVISCGVAPITLALLPHIRHSSFLQIITSRGIAHVVPVESLEFWKQLQLSKRWLCHLTSSGGSQDGPGLRRTRTLETTCSPSTVIAREPPPGTVNPRNPAAGVWREAEPSAQAPQISLFPDSGGAFLHPPEWTQQCVPIHPHAQRSLLFLKHWSRCYLGPKHFLLEPVPWALLPVENVVVLHLEAGDTHWACCALDLAKQALCVKGRIASQFPFQKMKQNRYLLDT